MFHTPYPRACPGPGVLSPSPSPSPSRVSADGPPSVRGGSNPAGAQQASTAANFKKVLKALSQTETETQAWKPRCARVTCRDRGVHRQPFVLIESIAEVQLANGARPLLNSLRLWPRFPCIEHLHCGRRKAHREAPSRRPPAHWMKLGMVVVKNTVVPTSLYPVERNS